jgi:8-hydroxy-5-deazaflavin:NADPH oxidoreductase
MKIGILGSGLMGGKLGTLWARAGHEVVFSYAKTNGKLERLAKEAGGKAKAGTVAEAAKDADALLLAVHWSRVDDVLKQAGNLSGKALLTCSLPMDAQNTKLILGLTTSGAEELGKKVPKAKVVSAFNTVPSEVLFGVFKAKAKNPQPSLVYCGDDSAAKKTAAKLISDVGFEPYDIGGLKAARYTEPFTMIVAEIAYGGKKGPEMAYRFEWLNG